MPMEPVIWLASSGEDVPEDVAGDDDVKLAGIADQLHGGVVHIEMVRVTSG